MAVAISEAMMASQGVGAGTGAGMAGGAGAVGVGYSTEGAETEGTVAGTTIDLTGDDCTVNVPVIPSISTL